MALEMESASSAAAGSTPPPLRFSPRSPFPARSCLPEASTCSVPNGVERVRDGASDLMLSLSGWIFVPGGKRNLSEVAKEYYKSTSPPSSLLSDVSCDVTILRSCLDQLSSVN